MMPGESSNSTWNKVYAAALGFTVALIIALWLFQRAFS